LISLLIDIASVLGIMGSLPALIRIYRNRKTLKDISLLACTLYNISSCVNITVGILVGAWFSVVINAWYITVHLLSIYWIWRKRRNEKLPPVGLGPQVGCKLLKVKWRQPWIKFGKSIGSMDERQIPTGLGSIPSRRTI